jgi:hypothetical protein
MYFGVRYNPIQADSAVPLTVEEYSLSEMSFATGQKDKKFDIPGW